MDKRVKKCRYPEINIDFIKTCQLVDGICNKCHFFRYDVIPHCPNKETDLNRCQWRGQTCFLCDMPVS
jgi:hypothetical protein